MKSDRWHTIGHLFERALECAGAERRAFLDSACVSDPWLRREVESLLASHERAGGFIETHAIEVAAPLLNADPDRLEADQVFGDYRIAEHLGSGGMGEVYLAHDARLERRVALKLLPSHFADDERSVRRFLREARAASALNHPNIVTVYEVGAIEDRYFIASEFVEGTTLRERIGGARLTPREIINIAAQIACALAAAHERGIVHRDIKPDNIMVGQDDRVKVLDFGIAKRARGRAAIGDEDSPVTLDSTPGLILGTTAYMSPEQARGLEVDFRTDVWSFGVVLYEMLAGVAPFRGATNSDLLVAILDREPAPLGAGDDAPVPVELRRIVAKALSKDPADRFASGREMEVALKSLLRRRAAELAPPTLNPDPPLSDRHEALGRLRSVPEAARASPAAGAATRLFFRDFARRASDYKLRLALALAALVIAAASLSSYFRAREPQTVAVLPFAYVDLDTDAADAPSRAYIADGITESVIGSLSQRRGLRVIARSSVFRYQGKEIDPRAVGRELGVETILTGRVTRRGDDLVISTEMIDAASNTRLWGERYERKASSLMLIPEQIAREAAARLSLPTVRDEQTRSEQRYTANGEAYRLYLLGRFNLNKRTDEGLRKSIECFDQALAADGDYALAYAGLADAYQLLANFSIQTSHEAYPRAIAAAERALRLDDSLAEAHASRAKIAFDYEWDWARAEREFERAISLNPSYAPAHQWYGGYLMALGRFDRALAELSRAQELDPLSLIINSSKGMIFFYDKRYDEAINQFRKPLDIDPNFFLAHAYLGFAYGEKKMYAEAIAEYEQAIQLSGGDIKYLGGVLGYTYAVSGQRDKARELLERLLARSRQTYVAPSDIAKIYIGLGESDAALAWLETAYAARSYGLQYANVDPHYDRLRADNRFADILRRVNPDFVR